MTTSRSSTVNSSEASNGLAPISQDHKNLVCLNTLPRPSPNNFFHRPHISSTPAPNANYLLPEHIIYSSLTLAELSKEIAKTDSDTVNLLGKKLGKIIHSRLEYANSIEVSTITGCLKVYYLLTEIAFISGLLRHPQDTLSKEMVFMIQLNTNFAYNFMTPFTKAQCFLKSNPSSGSPAATRHTL